MRRLVSHIASECGSRDEHQCQCTINFRLFAQFKTSAHGMMPSTFRISLPVSINPAWGVPHTLAQTFVSWLILEPVKLTVDVNRPSG